MKFLCPNCNAKYQISEEKVAGRSVKIHCRNCGFVIRVAQPSVTALTSHLASLRPPAPDASVGAAVAPRAPPRPPQPGPALTPESQATPLPRRAATAEPQATTLPRPGRGAGPPVAASGARVASAGAVGLARAQPKRAGAPSAGSEERAHELLRQATAPRESGHASRPRSGTPGALAGAFAKAVDVAPAAAEEMVSGDEWWVGIQDVPTGPLKLSDLRTKAAQGVVGPDSLVWREGFADWAPLKKYPELLAVLEEATSRTASSPQIVPGPIAPPAAAAAAVAISDPFRVGPAEAPIAVSAPRALAAATADLDGAVEQIAGLSKAPKVPVAAWLAVGVALVCGFTGGFVVFSSSPSANPANSSQAAALAAAPSASGAAQAALAEAAETPTVEAQASPNGPGAKSGHGSQTRNSGSSAQGRSPQAQGLAGLRGLSAGRSAGPSGSLDGQGAGSSSGQGLDADTLQKTVSRYKGSVNRSCWQPALDTRDTNAPTTARVSVTLVVAASGQVVSATTGGDPVGYRGLARCIEARVRGWQFPASRGNTTVNVPFVFAAQ
jgi:predicted Zn finger-like uncharacterized protein